MECGLASFGSFVWDCWADVGVRSTGGSQDYLTLRWMSAGVFSIAGMYKNLLAPNVQRKLESDSFTQNVLAPQRVCIFLWLFSREKTLTNEERTRRGMSNYLFWERCSLSVESAIHVVRDCESAQVVWKLVLPRSNWNVFLNFLLVKWIIWNIRNIGKLNFQSDEWGSFYSIVCWFLWKNQIVYLQSCEWWQSCS